MDKTSTQQSLSTTQPVSRPRKTSGPKNSTLAILRQFARAYQPSPLGGYVLN